MSHPVSTMPMPPQDLRARVTGDPDDNDGAFEQSGRQSVEDFEASLASVGRCFDQFSSILEFGCGCGRILRQLEPLSKTSSVHGTDIDAPAIDWAKANLTFAEVRVNDPLPPLGYPDGTFDLIFCHSVFTHIDETYQDRWLEELRRVTRVGALLVLSVHGEHVFNTAVEDVSRVGDDASSWQSALSERGILFVSNDNWVGGVFPDFYHTSFHAPWYIFAHWGKYFRVRSYLVQRGLGHQDYVVLERVGADTPLRPVVPRRLEAATSSGAGPAPGSGGFVGMAQLLRRRVGQTRLGGRLRQVIRAGEVDRGSLGELRHEVDRLAAQVQGLQRDPNYINAVTRDILNRQGKRISRLEEKSGSDGAGGGGQ